MNPKDTAFYVKKTLKLNGSLMELHSPKVMGILNATPDSFYDGGENATLELALKKADAYIAEGVDIIDVGGYSTRPQAQDISVSEELDRVIPLIEALANKYPKVPISIDTFRSEVAKKAVEAGASLINDVSGGNLDKSMFETVASLGVAYVLMHMRGTPTTMQQKTNYNDLIVDVVKELSDKCTQLKRLGVNDIIIDPGFGFAKTIEQNYEMLKKMSYFEILECPILVGISRKSMIYKLLDISAGEALNGTTALNMAALMNGASILRVHDVTEARQLVTLYNAMRN